MAEDHGSQKARKHLTASTKTEYREKVFKETVALGARNRLKLSEMRGLSSLVTAGTTGRISPVHRVHLTMPGKLERGQRKYQNKNKINKKHVRQ